MEVTKQVQERLMIATGAVLIVVVALVLLTDNSLTMRIETSSVGGGKNVKPVAHLGKDAQKQSSAASTSTANPQAETKQSPTGKTYTYTASAGDSFSTFASDAISEYAKRKGITLSPEAAYQAQTTLVNNAGSPLLDIGQIVTFKEQEIERAIPAQ